MGCRVSQRHRCIPRRRIDRRCDRSWSATRTIAGRWRDLPRLHRRGWRWPGFLHISIGHKEGDVYIIDVVRGTSGKFDPQSVTEEYAKLCRQYRIRSVIGDNYARDWVAGAWRKLGFEYIRSSRPKGAIYLESLPVFTPGLARLPNYARLIRDLRLLDRPTHP